MRKRLVSWLILVPLALVLVIFALANRQTVTVNFDPLSQVNPLVAPVTVPLFAVIYAMLLAGIVLGGIATWAAQSKNRKAKRAYKREAEALHREVDALRKPASQRQGLAATDELLEID